MILFRLIKKIFLIVVVFAVPILVLRHVYGQLPDDVQDQIRSYPERMKELFDLSQKAPR